MSLSYGLTVSDGEDVHDEPRMFVAMSKTISCERPYVMQFDGGLGVAYDVSGGLPNTMVNEHFASYSPILAGFSLYGDRNALRLLAANVNGGYAHGSYSIYSTQKGLRSAAGTTSYGFTAADLLPIGAIFPACDANLKELRGVAIAFAPSKVDRGQFALTKEGLEVAKKQKLWTCSSFRLRIDGLPIERVTHIDPITISLTGWTDPGADPTGMAKPIYEASHFAFRIPREDAALFYELHKATLAGAPKKVSIRLDYLDDEGSVAQVGMSGNTCEVAIADPFSDPQEPGNEFEVVFHVVKPDSSPTTGNLELIIK
jgi:hypothetical protein